jgi:site-specific recombinase XerD
VATVQEAVADAQVESSQEEGAEAGPGAARPRTRQDSRPEQPDVWLTPEQGRRLVSPPTQTTPRDLRDHAMLAVLISCGLRRGELLGLQVASIQQRDDHWVIADLMGKAGHIRTVPMPSWVKANIDAWTATAGITEGPVFRAINKTGRVFGTQSTTVLASSPIRLDAAVGRADAESALRDYTLPIRG